MDRPFAPTSRHSPCQHPAVGRDEIAQQNGKIPVPFLGLQGDTVLFLKEKKENSSLAVIKESEETSFAHSLHFLLTF